MEIYHLLRLKEGGKDHQRLPKVLSDLTLDKLILQGSHFWKVLRSSSRR